MAPRTLSLITLHGIGRPPKDYADLAIRRLYKALKSRGVQLHYQSIHYDPILDAASRSFQQDQATLGMDSEQLSSSVAIHTLSDALVGRNSRVQARIFDLIDTAVIQLRTSEVIFVTHSMGCSHVVDYLNARPLVRVRDVVTMANNSPLWYLGQPYPVPRQLAGGGRWLNLVERDDPLGAMMEHISGGVAVDLEVKLGGWLGWSGIVHGSYWNSAKIFEKLLPEFLTLDL